ncbi:MAG: ferritin [Bacteroidales bacterium]|jgi:ferritin|nr:ferritin [Bacteroidales bacterium]
MIVKNIEEALNEQINAEFWSAYFYLSMAMQCADKGLPGAENWFRVQFKEEQEHAEKFINYLLSRGGRVVLQPIAKVKNSWNSLLEMFEDTLKHEQHVTDLINKIYAMALDEKDFATQSMLNWFVDEQVEEEEEARDIIDALKLIGDGYGLYQYDRELATRVFVPLATK